MFPRSQPLQCGDGHGSDGDALDGALVASPADSEVAVLAPAGAPAVLDDPVLLPCLVAAAVPHQEHGVVGQLEGIDGVSEACVVVDALLVRHEVGVDLRMDRNLLFYISTYRHLAQELGVVKSGCTTSKATPIGPFLTSSNIMACSLQPP